MATVAHRFLLSVPFLVAVLALLPLSARPTEKSEKSEIPATGTRDKRLAPFDALMIDFLKKHPQVPGAALAVARDGKLVYSRGFGSSAHNQANPVHPNSRFRIASISKPITAVAILQLVERGKLKLDDRVFRVLGLKRPEKKGVLFDPRWREVTILELLRHRGGWDREKSFDPMFRSPAICAELKVPPPAMPDSIIRYMLRRPLDFVPGTRFAYSNFGYCLLGRVIEKVSGKSYEEYVREEVLLPVGAKDTRRGKTLFEDRLPNEVVYWANNRKGPAILGPDLRKPISLPYGTWCLEAMDSHGGWVSTAPDLVRFASAFDHPEKCRILNARSIELMFAAPPGEAKKETWYGCGWEVRPYGKGAGNTWHTGSLDGTSTLLVRRTDKLTWAVLFNTREHKPKQDEPAGQIDSLVHRAADAVKSWP